MLWLVVRLRGGSVARHGIWSSALALFGYAAGFSFAYLTLPAGIGALLLFGAVQSTMIGYGLWRGERLTVVQSIGLVLACTGLIGLLLPGVAAPPVGRSPRRWACSCAAGDKCRNGAAQRAGDRRTGRRDIFSTRR